MPGATDLVTVLGAPGQCRFAEPDFPSLKANWYHINLMQVTTSYLNDMSPQFCRFPFQHLLLEPADIALERT
jgi:hypothetical protein